MLPARLGPIAVRVTGSGLYVVCGGGGGAPWRGPGYRSVIAGKYAENDEDAESGVTRADFNISLQYRH